jgi:Tfp pilus assembly protein PilV
METAELKKGGTILEVLVSAVLLAIAFLGVSTGFLWSTGYMLVSERQLQATDFSKEVMDYLLAKDYDDAALSLGNHNGESFLGLPDCVLKKDFNARRSYDVESVTEGKKITVAVSWTEADKAKKQELSSLVIEE